MVEDNYHRNQTIGNWKTRGLLCREGETYDSIYDKVMETEECQLCNNKFTANGKYQRCMDHCHIDGYFRKVLCRGCNAKYMVLPHKVKRGHKTNHKWISITISNDREGKVPRVSFRYSRPHFKRKASTSLTKLIALSFIHLLKKPIS